MRFKWVSVYVIITARPLFRGRASPRGLSELTDDDDDDGNEKQNTSILRVGATCAGARRLPKNNREAKYPPLILGNLKPLEKNNSSTTKDDTPD